MSQVNATVLLTHLRHPGQERYHNERNCTFLFYSFCQVIKEIAGVKSNFRVLALSATPGGDMNVS